MTPKDIITKHVMSIDGIRIPFARMVVDRIFNDLEDYGYHIREGQGEHSLTKTEKGKN